VRIRLGAVFEPHGVVRMASLQLVPLPVRDHVIRRAGEIGQVREMDRRRIGIVGQAHAIGHVGRREAVERVLEAAERRDTGHRPQHSRSWATPICSDSDYKLLQTLEDRPCLGTNLLATIDRGARQQ
jgi:hypothetical protein